MAHCFQLTKIGETTPMTLTAIDNDMCDEFGAPVDPKRYFEEWVNYEGLELASGLTLAQVRDMYVKGGETARLPIIDWLLANYTACSFRS